MGFWSKLFGLFGGGEQREQAPVAVPSANPSPQASETLFAPGTRIAYDAGLIAHLRSDHHLLVALLAEVHDTFAAGNVDRAAALLNRFKSEVQAHLLTEEVRLYVYLQNALVGDKLNHSLMRHMHHEMSMISNDVLNFLGKYDALGRSPELRESFADDLGKVGTVLTERIEREETLLYPLYMSPVEMEKMRIQAPH
jgi:hypothetical protein